MKKINLLPWREKENNQQKKEFIIYWLSALFLCIGLIYASKILIVYQTNEYYLYKDQLLSRLSDISLEIQKDNQLKREINRLKNSINIMQCNHAQLRKILDFIVNIKHFTTPDIFIRIVEYQRPFLKFYIGATSEKNILALIEALQLRYTHRLQWKLINNRANNLYNFFLVTINFK